MSFLKKSSNLKSSGKDLYHSIKNIFGFNPRNIHLYKLAFRHKSANKDVNGIKINNERLEYLGDAVLSSVIADFLFKKFPYKGEGFLTEMRSKIVCRTNLNKLSRKMGLDKLIESSPEIKSSSKSMRGDAFEAFIGALYLDKGYDFAKRIIIKRIVNIHIDIDALEHLDTNFKSKLIEWAQKEKKEVDFRLIDEKNGKASKQYEVEIFGDKTMARFQDVTGIIDNDIWYEEFLDYKIVIGVINSNEEAITKINRYSGGHSATIITKNKNTAELFLESVDTAAVYHNASTRFTDGFQFGLGGELAISTDKLHQRGPIGLQHLVTNKWYILGDGQIR